MGLAVGRDGRRWRYVAIRPCGSGLLEAADPKHRYQTTCAAAIRGRQVDFDVRLCDVVR